ncbi:MAG: OmpH family outer membrane protein [Bacteroidetes bacterium]|nr:OmpH family outer membrane protein [Bacteroidota bacterium]
MNKLFLAGFILGFILVGCSKSKSSSTPTVEKRDMKGLKIAYYNSDTLKEQFVFFKEQDSIMTTKQKAFESELQRRQQEFEAFIAKNEGLMKQGLLSENEQVALSQKAQAMQKQIMDFQQSQGQVLEKEAVDKMTVIGNKVEKFAKEFSQKNKIDILLIHGKGGQIGYIDVGMDVTKEFVNYLNEKQTEIAKELK